MNPIRPLIFALALLVTVPAVSLAEDAQSILQTAERLRLERLDGVSSYTIDRTVMGQRQVVLYERTSVDVDGESVEIFRQVPSSELQSRSGDAPSMTPEQLELAADAHEQTGQALGEEMDRGMQQAGLPKGLLGAMGAGSADEPWASPDPRIMMGANAQFLRGAAAAQRANAAEAGNVEADTGLADFAARAKLVGSEKIDGMEAWHLRADGLDHRQAVDGDGEVVIDTMSLWIDQAKYVPLKMTMSGTMSMQGQSRAVQMERLDADYREVEGSSMYEPYRQVLRMGGVMTEKDRKEMAKAQVELAKFEKQMAEMPASQRQLMEQMMGPQLEMIRNMAASGGIEVITEVNEIIVN